MKHLIILLLVLFSNSISAQELSKSFLIVHSSKNYNSALKSAQAAANKMGVPMNLRNCYEDKEEGLTSSEICGCGERHGYIPRGRSDDGEYISIEFSSSYENFSPGYYIVVVSSGEDEIVRNLLSKAKEFKKLAYIKKSNVYMGCMH